MNYTGLITTQTKFQSPGMKDKWKHSFLVSWYSIKKYKTFVWNILFKISTPLAWNINFWIGVEESFQKMYTFIPPFFCGLWTTAY